MCSMLMLGSLGACPIGNFAKIDALRLNLRKIQSYNEIKGHLNIIIPGANYTFMLGELMSCNHSVYVKLKISNILMLISF